MMVEHQEQYYGGARLGQRDRPARLCRAGVPTPSPSPAGACAWPTCPRRCAAAWRTSTPDEPTSEIAAYNQWAGEHEHIMAKSLFCAGTTWPGVFLAEDQRALDVLCARDDVDASARGLRRAVGRRDAHRLSRRRRTRASAAPCCVGMMTTWRDYLLNKCHTHTWMVYVPLLAAGPGFPRDPGPARAAAHAGAQRHRRPALHAAGDAARRRTSCARCTPRRARRTAIRCYLLPRPAQVRPAPCRPRRSPGSTAGW